MNYGEHNLVFNIKRKVYIHQFTIIQLSLGKMKIDIGNKHYSLIAYIASFFTVLLFLLLGSILTLFSLQSLFIGISGIGLSGILYFLIGIYLVYKPVTYIRFLIKNKGKFNDIFDDFIRENKKAVIIATISSVVLLSLFYSGISTNFDFFVSVVLYLPKFILDNLVFIVNIFLFEVSKFIAKFFKAKRR